MVYIIEQSLFSRLKKIPETDNNHLFHISKLFFSLNDNRFSCPVNKLLHISIQTCYIYILCRSSKEEIKEVSHHRKSSEFTSRPLIAQCRVCHKLICDGGHLSCAYIRYSHSQLKGNLLH